MLKGLSGTGQVALGLRAERVNCYWTGILRQQCGGCVTKILSQCSIVRMTGTTALELTVCVIVRKVILCIITIRLTVLLYLADGC